MLLERFYKDYAYHRVEVSPPSTSPSRPLAPPTNDHPQGEGEAPSTVYSAGASSEGAGIEAAPVALPPCPFNMTADEWRKSCEKLDSLALPSLKLTLAHVSPTLEIKIDHGEYGSLLLNDNPFSKASGAGGDTYNAAQRSRAPVLAPITLFSARKCLKAAGVESCEFYG